MVANELRTTAEPRTRPTIFISHISEEADLAAIFKEDFEDAFVGEVQVFASSDFESISAGLDWRSATGEALRRADIEIVLCSPFSISRPWINFEAGAGWLKGIPVVPVCHSGIHYNDLPSTFSGMQGVEADQIKGLQTIHALIAETLGRNRLPNPVLRNGTLEKIRQFEARYKTSKAAIVPQASAEYCDASLCFHEHHKTYFDKTIWINREDRSDLWYIFINTKVMRGCKRIVEETLRDIEGKATRGGRKIYDIYIWSLLGAAELLVKFRSPDNELVQEVKQALMVALSFPKLLKTETTDASYADGVLESTHMNIGGLSMINVVGECVLDTDGRGPFFAVGSVRQKGPLPDDIRSIKVFIKLHFNRGFDEARKTSIASRIGRFDKTVETYAISSRQGDAEQMIIEAHFPCGKFWELRELSTELESELFGDLVKETYLAYDQRSIGLN
jgi:hypothetical protein